MPKRPCETIRVTAEDFCRTLYGVGVDAANVGTYPGTDIPVRKIPSDAVLTVTDCGVNSVTDDQDGWIADRILGTALSRGRPTIGRRQWRKLKSGN